MTSFAAAYTTSANTPKKLDNVIFSYQGSFGPPTYGHYKSMEAFAQQLSTEYSGEIKMYFMMSPGGSKTHLFPTQEMRKRVLQMFCDMLKLKYTDERITFEVGNEEIEIAITKPKQDTSIGTIETIDLLSTKFDKNKYNICLGMGLDNAYQLPYWAKINEYFSKVYKIYVIPRTPSEAELNKTRKFIVENTDKSKVEMRFDVMVPWKNDTFLNCFLPSGHTDTKDTVNTDNLISKLTLVNDKGKEPYMFHQKLPPVVVLTSEESASAASTPKLSIPATSSSMMRYFIGQYSQEIDTEINLTKIQKLMFGPGTLTEEQKAIVMDTINDYKNNVFNGKYPADDKIAYETQYTSIEGFSGGNRKTKRRRTNKKRRSQRKKRRSQRK